MKKLIMIVMLGGFLLGCGSPVGAAVRISERIDRDDGRGFYNKWNDVVVEIDHNKLTECEGQKRPPPPAACLYFNWFTPNLRLQKTFLTTNLKETNIPAYVPEARYANQANI